MAPICCNEQTVQQCLDVMLHAGFEPHAAMVGALLGVNEHSLMIFPFSLVSPKLLLIYGGNHKRQRQCSKMWAD